MCFAIGCKVEKFKIDIGEKFEKFVHFQLNAPCVCLFMNLFMVARVKEFSNQNLWNY